jgi:ribosome-binding ATPase
MALKAGIVGLPNVGKSTIFNALTNAGAQAANFPFCTIEPNLGIISVPDKRLDKLVELVNPKSVVPTSVEIVDIAGLVKGASKGEGLGNQFLGNIRSVDAIIHVIRCFDDENVVHVDGSIDPLRDKEIIDVELQLKDLETLDKRIDKQRKAAKSGDKVLQKEVELLQQIKQEVESGKSIRELDLGKELKSLAKELDLLTAKPVLYLCNVDESSAIDGNKYVDLLIQAVQHEPAEVLVLSAAIEAEIAGLESLEERNEFLEMIGLKEPGLFKLINSTYLLLHLITFFTAGEKEVRAWTITRNTKAPQAAGTIHTDFEKGFIRAEVISYEDYVNYKSEAAVKEAGKMRVEGKEYVLQDGDVMHFRFNV